MSDLLRTDDHATAAVSPTNRVSPTIAMKRRKGYNPKRRIAPAGTITPEEIDILTRDASYKGNPEHKLHPADYGLAPPPPPRPGKSLCDAEQAVPKEEAQALLLAGMKKGMVSVQRRGNWPQNVWAVSDESVPFEAQLENQYQGDYHGYPMPQADDFRNTVLREWKERQA